MALPVLKPFFGFYGSKWRLAPKYPTPKHRVVVEPFAGSAGYALRHWTHDVVLVDRDPTIAALWRYLIGVTAEEIRALPLLEPYQDVHDLAIAPEARSLIGFWLNKASQMPCRRPSKWMREGVHRTSFWGETIRERVASQVDFIRHWTIIEGDYSDAPDIEATWFVDPPYSVRGARYRYSSRLIDFSRLGAWTQARRGQVIACENAGATWLPFREFAHVHSNPAMQRGASVEAIWTNDE